MGRGAIRPARGHLSGSGPLKDREAMTAPEHKAIFLRPAEAATPDRLSVRAISRAVLRGEFAAVVREGADFRGEGLCKSREV
jgi:hypothetical protein